jgi:drug/metabolite transporter (DMT)-like permease
VVVLAWSSTFTALEIALDSSPAVLFVGLRCLLGGAVVAALAYMARRPPRLRSTWRIYLTLAWWNVVTFLGFQALAVRELPSGQAAVLIYLQPIIVSALASRRLGESMGPRKAVGLLAGLCGLAAAAGTASSGPTSLAGVLYAVLGAASWAVGTVAFKRHHAAVDPLWAMAIPFVAGGVALSVLGLIVEGPVSSWTAPLVAALAYSALVGTALGWWVWLRLVTLEGAGRVSANLFLVPVVSTVLGVLLLGETFETSMLVGGLLVVAGVYLVTRTDKASAI